jgi:hypothetical protein
MGIIPGLFLAVLNLICIGIDITMFFVLCHIVLMWRKIPWLEKLNDIGKGLVDALAGYAGQLWYKATQKHLTIRGELLLSLMALLLLRIIICQIGSLFLKPEHANMKTMVIHKFEEESQASDAIRMHLRLLGHKNYGVTELRIFDPVPMVAYVDNEDDAVSLALRMEGRTSGIYVGVQPRPLHLYEFAPNCWRPATSSPVHNCATDNDIDEYITVCFWDLDVVSEERSKGHPASDEELKQSLHAAELLSSEEGLALNSVICCSGNGHYVLTPIVPISVDSIEVARQFKQCCQQIAQKVTSQIKGVKIDPVYNLSRVMRLMGTVNGKGQTIEGRPHRKACFVTEPTPARSMALYYMILNTEVDNHLGTEEQLPKAIRCDLNKLENCEFIQWCRKYPELVTEPLWFGLIANLVYLDGGIKLIHEISRLDMVRYDYSNTHRIIQRVFDKGYKPITCKNLIDIALICPESIRFNCSKLTKCPARAPMYLATLNTVYKR